MAFISPELEAFIGILISIMMYSFVYKENPLARFVEHMVIGIIAAYTTLGAISNIDRMAIKPLLAGDITLIIPIIFGLMLYARFSNRYLWVSRYSVAVNAAIGTAISVRLLIYTDFIKQIQATIINPIGPSAIGTPPTPLNNILFIIMTVSTIIYFIFTGGKTIQKMAVVRGISYIGRYTLMIGFGAAFASLVATRTAQIYDRFFFFLDTPLNRSYSLIATIFTASIILYISLKEYRAKTT